MSLTVALEGTSRRGHFICRYCTGDRRHKASGELRSREHPERAEEASAVTTIGLLLLHTLLPGQRPNDHLWGGHMLIITPHHFVGDTHNSSPTIVSQEPIGKVRFPLLQSWDKQGSSRDQELPDGDLVPFPSLLASHTILPKKWPPGVAGGVNG